MPANARMAVPAVPGPAGVGDLQRRRHRQPGPVGYFKSIALPARRAQGRSTSW